MEEKTAESRLTELDILLEPGADVTAAFALVKVGATLARALLELNETLKRMSSYEEPL